MLRSPVIRLCVQLYEAATVETPVKRLAVTVFGAACVIVSRGLLFVAAQSFVPPIIEAHRSSNISHMANSSPHVLSFPRICSARPGAPLVFAC
jgi:hypothetical protein